MSTRAAGFVVAFLALAPEVGAQPAARPRSSPRSCTLGQHPLPPELAEILDPASPVAVVATRDGAFVALRDRVGALRLARTDDALVPRGAVRELAGQVGAFAMVATREGVGVAWVEGDITLLLARIDGENELENVPRVLAASGERIDRVVLARVGEDLAAAWSTRERPRSFALRTDRRAVPRGGAQGMGEGSVRELRALGDGALSLTLDTPTGEAWAISLDDRGRELSRARWPASARGPITLDGVPWAVNLGAAGIPTLSRAFGATPAETPTVGTRLESIAEREGVALAVVSDPRTGRTTLTRLDLAGGSFAPMAFRAVPAGPGSIALGPGGEVIVVGREGRRALLLRARCGR